MVTEIPDNVKHPMIAKKLCLANGDEFEMAEFNAADDRLQEFIPIKTEGKIIYVNPEFIISFETAK